MNQQEYDNLNIFLESIFKIVKRIDEKSSQGTEIISHRSAETKELFCALSQAQLDMPIAIVNKTNPYFMLPYADLAEVVRVSRPSLSKNGLSVIQQILSTDEGQSILHTILCHSSGQWIESQNRIIPPKNDIQSLSSYITALKRIAYAAICGVVVADEDDDGEIAMANAREIIAKGPAINSYNPKDQSSETITKEQLEDLEYELSEYPDLAEEVMDLLKIQSLASMPKNQFKGSITRIRKIRAIREGKINANSVK